MGFKNNSVVSFKTKTDVGINRAPLGSIIEVQDFNGQPRVFVLNNKELVDNTTTIEDAYINENISAMINFIETPSITSPVEGDTDIVLTPNLTSSAYVLSDGVIATHLSTQWQVSLDITFNNIVHDITSEEDLFSHVTSALNSETTLYTRCRYRSAEFISNWSKPVSFTTQVASIETPTLSLELGDPVYRKSFVVNGSDFTVIGSTDTHETTTWELLNSAGDTVLWSSVDDAVNLTSITVPENYTDVSTDYIIQATYHGATYSSQIGSLTFTTVDHFVIDPILAGAASADENTTENITISNYDNAVIYNIDVTGGVFSQIGDTISWTLPEVGADTDIEMRVYTIVGDYTSNVVVKSITVIDKPVLLDTDITVNFDNYEYNNEWSL